MTDAGRVAEALRQAGFTISSSEVTGSGQMFILTEEGLTLTRSQRDQAFIATGNTSRLSEVGKKYAEIGMRQWARRNGLMVRSADEKGATLVSVRR